MKKLFALILTVLLVFALLAFPALAETAEAVTDAPAPAPAFTVDLTQIIVSIIGLVFSFLLTWLIKAVVPPVKKWLEARTTAQQRDMLNTLTRQLVYAAEQTIGVGHGKEKMTYVCQQLRNRGYNIDLDIIEATVKEMNDLLLDAVIEDETAVEIEPPDEE